MILHPTHARSTRLWIFLLLAILLVPVAATAQPADANETGQENQATNPPVAEEPGENEDVDDPPAVSTEPRVLCAYRHERSPNDEERDADTECSANHDGCPENIQSVYLEERLVVRVDHLTPWLKKEKKDRSDLRLFLDGVELAGLEPEAVQDVEGQPTQQDVRFRLTRDAENRGSWRGLLGPFTFKDQTMSVGLGLSDQEEIPSDAEICFVPIRTGWFVVFLIVLGLALFGFGWAANKSELLRDRHADVTPKPYSLARCQMAWWFFLIVAAYIFLWLVLRDLDTITGSVVVLLGVGSGTALGAAAIDSSKKATEERAPETIQGAVKRRHDTFLSDILSDKNGFSFHRFQIVVWTLVLGIIFIYSVWHDLAMPQFSETLLGLMGISAGTYLGFKFPERFETEGDPEPEGNPK